MEVVFTVLGWGVVVVVLMALDAYVHEKQWERRRRRQPQTWQQQQAVMRRRKARAVERLHRIARQHRK
ncbi:hypothetical protein PV726_37780 [Streptomyces europaeiscabiei]|uniref:hypothetical protein n=1 Tax=Streptomyces europaeiscabiei TaxID=146819 RepID=UPI0029BC16A1|nr:hypothetical protein [Streptomyces europaeiscabiei]MDX3695970.1 hypothetical protein [Streptomyces europaeiscabiei]